MILPPKSDFPQLLVVFFFNETNTKAACDRLLHSHSESHGIAIPLSTCTEVAGLGGYLGSFTANARATECAVG
jgi:hypothetical protein